jgi:hypothetical protein
MQMGASKTSAGAALDGFGSYLAQARARLLDARSYSLGTPVNPGGFGIRIATANAGLHNASLPHMPKIRRMTTVQNAVEEQIASKPARAADGARNKSPQEHERYQ